MKILNVFATLRATNVISPLLTLGTDATLAYATTRALTLGPTTGVTLRWATDGLLEVRNFANSAAANLSTAAFTSAAANITFNGNVATAAGGQYSFAGRGQIQAPANGIWRISDSTDADFTRLIFGANSATGVAWKKSTTTLQAKLGDDSGYATVDALAYQATGYASGARSTLGAVRTVTEALTLTGATTATANIIPAGAIVVGVATTTTTEITGASGYTVGTVADPDRYGDITGTAVGTNSDNTDATADPFGYNAAASPITLTAKTSDFTGGVVQVTVAYLTTAAA